jgi:methanogenic corrinoid protein MtbC1
MKTSPLEKRIDLLNHEIEHLYLLSKANYDCDKEHFESIIKKEIERLIDTIHQIEDELEEQLNFGSDGNDYEERVKY